MNPISKQVQKASYKVLAFNIIVLLTLDPLALPPKGLLNYLPSSFGEHSPELCRTTLPG